MVKATLRLEGLFFFLSAIYFYQLLHGGWMLFIILFFTPDVSMVGYIKDKKLGAILYNLMHNYILALLIIAIGFLILKNNTLILVGLILFAHISIDRFFGYGLKYSTNFKDTHTKKV